MKFQNKLTRTEMRNISGGTGVVGAPIKTCAEEGGACDTADGRAGSVGCCENLVCKVYAWNLGFCACP